MALSEYEQRVWRDIEAGLQDCERRGTALQRRMQRRSSRRWWILLCLSTPILGAGLITLGAMAAHGGIVIALLGSAVLAIPCACVRPLCSPRTGGPELCMVSPETERP